ncbi:MAG: hypothetical protein ACI9T8_000165 [Candidatus Saccharimonadales bacterium]|jgi:hypothetical protein
MIETERHLSSNLFIGSANTIEDMDKAFAGAADQVSLAWSAAAEVTAEIRTYFSDAAASVLAIDELEEARTELFDARNGGGSIPVPTHRETGKALKKFEDIFAAGNTNAASVLGRFVVFKGGSDRIIEGVREARNDKSKPVVVDGVDISEHYMAGEKRSYDLWETPELRVLLDRLVDSLFNAYSSQYEITGNLGSMIDKDPRSVTLVSKWVEQLHESSSVRDKSVLKSLWADIHDANSPGYIEPALQRRSDAIDYERFIERYIDHARICPDDDIIVSRNLETIVAFQAAVSALTEGATDVASTFELWPDYLLRDIEEFGKDHIKKAAVSILSLTSNYGAKFRVMASSGDVAETALGLLPEGGSDSALRNKSTRRKRKGGRVTPRKKNSSIGDGQEEIIDASLAFETNRGAERVTTVSSFENGAVDDSVMDNMVAKFVAKYRIAKSTDMTRVIGCMLDAIKQNPHGDGVETIRSSYYRHNRPWLEFSPMRRPGFDAPGQMRLIRIVFAYDKDSKAVVVDGIYTHEQFDTRVKELVGGK